MDQSILDSIKKLLNIEPDDTSFDDEILIHINSAFSTLRQVGVGPDAGFSISNKTDLWFAFLNGVNYLNDAKTYVYLSVKLVFDPPAQSFVIDSLNARMKELEWRLYISADEARKDAANARPAL